MPRTRHPLSVEDLWSIKRIGTPTLSPDGGEARRLTSVATGALGLRWFPDSRRIAFISWVWPDLETDRAQAKRRKERKEAKVKAHLSERSEYRFWDHWLTDGRVPHVL